MTLTQWTWSLDEVRIALGTSGFAQSASPFDFPRLRRSQDETRHAEQAMWERLRKQNLLERDGRLDRDMEALLALFAGKADADCVVTVAGEFSGGHSLRGRVVRGRHTGIGAWQLDDGVRFEQLGAQEVLPAVADSLGPLEPAAGRAVTVPSGERARQDESDLGPPLHDTGRPRGGDDVEAARELLSRPQLAHGVFMCFGPDYDGALVHVGSVAWFDTDQGRWLFHTPQGAGRGQSEITPASNRDICSVLERMVRRPGS